MLPCCPVLCRWAVKFSNQNSVFSWIKREKKTTMQNSFWFLGAEGRFQEIKQTISFGNSPKSGAFWPQSRGRQPLLEVERFYFSQRISARAPEGWAGEFPGGGLWAAGQSFALSFSHLGAWDRNWRVGGVGGQPWLGHSPGQQGGPLVDPDLLVGNACSKGSYSTVYLALSKGRM